MVDMREKDTLPPPEAEIPINIEDMTEMMKKRNPERGKILEQMLLPQVSKPETIEEMIEKLNAKDLARGKRLEELELTCSSLKVRLDKITGNFKMLEKESIVNSLKEEEKAITEVKCEMKNLKSKQSSLESKNTKGLNDLNTSFKRISKEVDDLKKSVMSQTVWEDKSKGIKEWMDPLKKRLDSLEACMNEFKAKLTNFEESLVIATESHEKFNKHEGDITTLADLKNLILTLNKNMEEKLEGVAIKIEEKLTKLEEKLEDRAIKIEEKLEGVAIKIEEKLEAQAVKIDTLSSDIKKNGRMLASLQFNLLSYELKRKTQEKREFKHYDWNKRRFEIIFENLESPFGRTKSR